MASDEIQPDLLRTAEATPIAKLSPAIADAAAVVVEGVVTVTWPYSIVRKSVAFILAERDPLHRRDKGQLRVEFDGAAGKALAGSGLGGGDEVRLSLDGARWEQTQASMMRPGILEWQLRFSNRLLLKVRRADTHEVDTIEVDAADDEGGQEAPEQLREPSPTPSIELEHDLFATPLPRTPLSTIPQKRPAYETLGSGEYASPAFLKRARVSYGSLFEGGFDIFDEEEPAKSTKKKRKPRFSMGPTAWRYTSRSPTPETEQEEPAAEGEDEVEAKDGDVEAPVVDEQTAKQAEMAHEPPASQPQPVMVDQGCQTRELSSSPTRGVQIIAESRSTGILLQPTPTHPWKHTDMDDVLQEPSPISFDFAVTHDVHPLMHEPETLDQSGAHVPHTALDMPMDLDPSLRPREADGQHPHRQPTSDLAATEAAPPRQQEPGAHDAQLHGLAWAAKALAPDYPVVPSHNTHDYPQGSFDRSSYTLRASPSDETQTLVSSGHHGVELHGYVRADESQRVSSSSFEQRDGVKPGNSYPERYEDDTETATVTATLGRESRSSPPQEESSTDESEEDEDEAASHRYYDWNTGRWREGYPEEEDDDQRHADYDDEDDEIEEDDDEGEDEEDEDVDSQSIGSDVESEFEGESEEDELEHQGYHQAMQPMPPTHRPYLQASKPAPALPKEPIFISLLSDDDEDDADNASAPTQPTQPKKEPSEERVLYDHDDIRDQPSEEGDEGVGEPIGEDVDKYIDEDVEGSIDEDVEGDVDDKRDDSRDGNMDDNLEDAGEESDVEEVTEARMMATDTPSRRSSRISQLDGADDFTEHRKELATNKMPYLEMDHPNLILSPKADKQPQQYADVAGDVEQVRDQDELPRPSSPSDGRHQRQHEFVAVRAIDSEEIPSVVMRDISTHRSPEPLVIKTTSIIIEEKDELSVSEQKPVQEQEQPTESLEGEDSTAAEEPSNLLLDERTEMTDAVEALAQQLTGNDDLIMEDVHPNTLDIQQSAVEVEVEVEVEVTAIEQDVEMGDDLQSQLRDEAEARLQEEDNQTATDIAPKANEEPGVAAPSSPPVTQREPSHTVPVAVSRLDDQEITERSDATEQLPTPLETQQEDYGGAHGAADMAHLEASPNEEETDQSVHEDVHEDDDEDVDEEYEDADDGVNEGADEEFEDATEGEEDGDDDDLAIQQQLFSEIQHYASPLRARDADRAGQASLQLPETIAEIDESQQSAQSQRQDTQQDSPQSQHSHHGHHDHHDHQHSGHCSHDRSPRRAGTEMSITLQSLRSHCRAKRMSSGSADSLSTDPSVLLARGSPTMAHRQCLLGEGDSLPQRSPRSPRNKAEHSDPSVALAKSSPRESVSPRQAEATPSLRARRGIRGSDASIILAQSFSTPSELSPASPTRSFRAGQRKSEKPDFSVQLATASFSRDAQQPSEHQGDHAVNHNVLDGDHQDDAPNPRRDVTPEPTVAGHNLRSPRKPAASSFKAPSVASTAAEDGNVATLKLQLLKALRTKLPDCLPLKSLRTSLTKTADILAVATLTPRQAHRPKHGPRDYMLELHLTDPSVAPTSVNVAHIFRPHQASLPTVQAGDVVLLRRVQVVSMQGRGFGVRAGEASAWAVFEKDDGEMLPQIKGPPVEVSEEEVDYVLGLRRWWTLQDDKALAKIEKANQKMLQAVRDDTK